MCFAREAKTAAKPKIFTVCGGFDVGWVLPRLNAYLTTNILAFVFADFL